GAERREVLQVIRAAVSVSWVIGRHSVIAEVDAELAVGEYRIAQNRGAGPGLTANHDTVADVVGDYVGRAGRQAAHGIHSIDEDAVPRVGQGRRASSVGADQVALYEVARRRQTAGAGNIDTQDGVARNDVARSSQRPTDRVARSSEDTY